jgi:MFS family permease
MSAEISGDASSDAASAAIRDQPVPHPAKMLMLLCCVGAFLAFLDATIVNIAFPAIWGHWLPGGVLIGLGVGLAFPALGGAALQGVEDRQFGVASAINNTARQLGAVLGVSLLVVVLSSVGPDPAVQAKHAWIFAGVTAALCGLVALALPRHSTG